MQKNIAALTPATLVALAALAAPLGQAARAGELVYGVTENQTLISFDSNAPTTILSGVAIWGMAANEQVRGLDFRPATNELYALGSFSMLYKINAMTGMAMQVGSGTFAHTLNGSSFGFDFNPVIDRIRVVSEADQNLVLNPITAASTNATALFYAMGDANEGMNPNVVGSAYTNSKKGATSTQLYGIDTNLDILVKQANSAGTLTTVGSLGVNLNDQVGFDISGLSGIAYASVQDATLGQSTFWTINLNTGAATMIGAIGGGSQVGAITVVPAPGALAALAGAGVLALRRRRGS
ncbi:MAG: DUF4394 domain-containing protein [Phycisphaerales bacterium]|nr:DUF4394 domain-containing protein [Phycisphaerales bacterium]